MTDDLTSTAVALRARFAALPAAALEAGVDVDVARRVATQLHSGQWDRAGAPYITHPLRVAQRVAAVGGPTIAVVAALLHDVVEDTPVTLDDLVGLGASAALVEVLDALTRREGETYAAVIERAASNPVAALVKLADLADNLDPERVARLDEAAQRSLGERYGRARARLAGAYPDLAAALS